MSGKNDKKMGMFLREVCNMQWDEFVRAENDESYTSNQAIIFGLIRACTMQKMPAIVMSLNRLDGKLKTPVEIEYPKIFYIYPNAKVAAGDTVQAVGAQQFAKVTDDPKTVNEVELISVAESSMEVLPPPEPEAEPEDPNDLPSMSLRETVDKMSDYPRDLPRQIIENALVVEQALNSQSRIPDENPRVKSVVAAHLLTMAANRNLVAINEVFDQIDGKLTETIQVLGEDIYITNYSSIAPEGAVLNDKGIFVLQAMTAQNMWAERLGALLK